MSDDVEVSSEETDNTPVIEESAPQAESGGAETQESAPEKQPEEKVGFNDPRHPDHSRFKELLDGQKEYKQRFEDSERERAQYRQSVDSMQRELQHLREQAIPKKEVPKDEFLENLEKVNPAWAKSLQAVYDQAGKTSQLEQRIAQYETQQYQKEAITHFNGLLESNKVTDPYDRKIYERAIRAEVYDREARGQKLAIKDLDKIVNDFHSEYKKAMEDRERAITAKYVTAKKADVTPKGATGGAASTPTAKKIAAGDISGQAKWLADQIRAMKKTI